MLESYIRTGDGKDYIDVDCVRKALGIKEDENIFLAIKKLRDKTNGIETRLEITDNFVDKVCEAVDIQRPYYLKSSYDNAVKLIANIKRERDELNEKYDKLKKRANAAYGVSCGYSGEKDLAFLCNVISYSWSFGAIDTPFPNNSIRVELNLTPTANYKGTFDMEDLRRYIQEYGREKKLGIVESVDYQNAKAARAELAYLYKTVLGKERLDRDLSPHEVMTAISNEYVQREEFIRALSCSLGFGNPVVKPDNIDQKEKDILERVEGLKSGVWPCENSSTFAEYLRKEFPKFCKEYNVAPIADESSVRDWIKYIFENLVWYRDTASNSVGKADEFMREKRALKDSLYELRAKIREIYRSVVDDEWPDHLSFTSALNDIKEEYERVVHNFEERTSDWSKAQQELDRYKLAVGSLLDIPKEARGDINAIERSFDVTNKKYKSLKEFRNDVCEILDIPSNMEDKYILKELHDVADRYDDLEDFRSDICGILDIEGMLGTPQQNDKYILEQVEKLNGGSTKLDRYARFRSNICTALCLGGETSDEDILKRVRMTSECHDKLCKDYAKLHEDYIASQKQVKGFTNRCDSLENLRRDLWEFRRNAIEDLKNRGFCFKPEENETLPEIYGKLLKRYDWAYGEYKEQYRLRQMWHVRWESEHERANGEHKRAEKLQKWNNSYAEVRRLLGVSADADAETMIAAVKLLRDKDPMNLQKQNDDLIAGYNELMSYKIQIEKELHKKDLKLSDSERRRKMWMARYESEHERANGEHRRAEGCFNDIAALKTQVSHLMRERDAMTNEEVGLQSLKNAVRKLQDEKTKVIEALGQDIWDDAVK